MRTFSRDELIKAAGELAFETQHFRCYGTLKDDAKLRAFSAAASQAVGYSLLIHLRVLMDFFFAVSKDDDCHIEHFKTLPEFAAAFPDSLHVRTTKTKAAMILLNKRMAHMTATRWEKPAQAWGYYDEYDPRFSTSSQSLRRRCPPT